MSLMLPFIGIALAVSMIILMVLMCLIGPGTPEEIRCPSCHVGKMSWIDSHVFYDPAPDYSLHRCDNCGHEMVCSRAQWVPRADWDGDDPFQVLSQTTIDPSDHATNKGHAPSESET